MTRFHRVSIRYGIYEFCELDLPILEVAPGVHLAVFNPRGDWLTCERAGKGLSRILPSGTEILFMPAGKAEALLHVVGRESGLPTIVAPKEKKGYMGECLETSLSSITSGDKTASGDVRKLYLPLEDAKKMAGKKVTVVDDVVSTGGSYDASNRLIVMAGGICHGAVAVFSEGKRRDDVFTLGHLPLHTPPCG